MNKTLTLPYISHLKVKISVPSKNVMWEELMTYIFIKCFNQYAETVHNNYAF
jgi:hypothetical protein